MKKVLSLVFILFLIGGVQSALTQLGDGPIWVSGEVSSIFQDRNGAMFSLIMANGEPYNISATSEMVKSINVGDYVTVKINNGWAELIEKAGLKATATQKPEQKEPGPQWVAGTLVAITSGIESSLLSIKMSNDEVFNVSASNELLSGINIGDYLTVKIVKGWAEAVTKK